MYAIDANDMPIETILKDFYTVPDYQREYVWESKQVEQLLEDIHEEFEYQGSDKTEYFIGSIVTLKQADAFDLIDGQQRLTTLFVILCAIRDRLRTLGEAPPDVLKTQIASSGIDASGKDTHRFRVDLQYEDSQGVLEQIGSEPSADRTAVGPDKHTRSVANILAAYDTVEAFLKQNLQDDPDAIRQFFVFLIKNVKMIRVETTSIPHALKIFETINDRGVGLDSMDLLKNLLFMNANKDEFDKIKDIWKDIVDRIYEAQEKPLRFMRYFIFANYNADRLREDQIYEWFRENERTIGVKDNPVAFANQIRESVKAYVNFLHGKNADGSPNRYLNNMWYLSGAARQHMILLLAGKDLPKDGFIELTKHVENLFFVYIVTRESTREFERAFAQWSSELREADTKEDVDGFIRKYFVPEKQKLSQRFHLALQQLTEDSIQKYRIKYILAKLSQYVDEMAQGQESMAGELKNYINKKVETEHILPQSPNAEVESSFDRPEELSEYVRRLGNLTLLEKSLNDSAGNRVFEEKRQAFRNSSFLLTRSLAQPIKVGSDTAYDRAGSYLEEFTTWQSSDIERRQEMLCRLAHNVWDVPVSSTEQPMH